MANNYKGRKLYSYDQNFKNRVLGVLIEAAEDIEYTRFVELYAKMVRPDWDILDSLGLPSWKEEYKWLLRNKEKIQMNSNLQDTINLITKKITADITSKQNNIDKIINNTLSQVELDKNIKYKELMAYKGGLELERDIVINRFLQIRNVDSKAYFVESQGNWEMELAGDYYWTFGDSKIKHWGEIKSNLDDFHITGTQSVNNSIIEPILSLGYIQPNRAANRYTLFIPKQAIIDVGELFLKRKYGNTKSFPIYESGDDILLSSELFQAFIDNNLELYRKPDQDIEFTPMQYQDFYTPRVPEIVSESQVEQQIQEETKQLTKQNQKNIIQQILKKYHLKLDLWYSK